LQCILKFERMKTYNSLYLMVNKGIFYRLYNLISKHQNDKEWLETILDALSSISSIFCTHYKATDAMVELNFLPLLFTLLKRNMTDYYIREPLFTILQNLVIFGDVMKACITCGLSSYIINLALHSDSYLINNFPLGFLLIFSELPKTSFDTNSIMDILKGLPQKRRLVFHGIRNQQNSFLDSTIIAMIRHKTI
jgi:hypothetical protein